MFLFLLGYALLSSWVVGGGKGGGGEGRGRGGEGEGEGRGGWHQTWLHLRRSGCWFNDIEHDGALHSTGTEPERERGEERENERGQNFSSHLHTHTSLWIDVDITSSTTYTFELMSTLHHLQLTPLMSTLHHLQLELISTLHHLQLTSFELIWTLQLTLLKWCRHYIIYSLHKLAVLHIPTIRGQRWPRDIGHAHITTTRHTKEVFALNWTEYVVSRFRETGIL